MYHERGAIQGEMRCKRRTERRAFHRQRRLALSPSLSLSLSLELPKTLFFDCVRRRSSLFFPLHSTHSIASRYSSFQCATTMTLLRFTLARHLLPTLRLEISYLCLCARVKVVSKYVTHTQVCSSFLAGTYLLPSFQGKSRDRNDSTKTCSLRATPILLLAVEKMQ